MSGTLHLVATPIGNLADVTLRALDVLRSVAVVACEDTRHTRVLLQRHGVHARLEALPAFDEARRAEGILEHLRAGRDVALVTDAGMPGVSDPGAALVALAVAEGIRVVPVPGASAPVAALAASGLPTDRFAFFGFLPRKGGARRDALRALAAFPGTTVILESPRRLHATLEDLTQALGPRRACVARELTKVHEELVRGTLPELAARFAGEVLGEVTLVIEGPPEAAPADAGDLDAALRRHLDAGLSVKDAARAAAQELDVSRREAYERALELVRS